MHRSLRHGDMTDRKFYTIAGAWLEVLEPRRLLSDTITITSTTTSSTTTKMTWTAPTRTEGVVATTVASASTAAAPELVTVSAAGRSHRLTVTWQGVEGATNYTIERNDGSGWVTAGEVGTIAKFVDSGLAEQTTYRYRVTAISNGATWGTSTEAQGATAAFRLFDGTQFQNRPSPMGPGIETIRVAYEHEFKDWLGQLSKSHTQALARQSSRFGAGDRHRH
jgi:hypothetical protein